MAQQSHLLKIPEIPVSSKDEFRPCRTTIFIMQFFRNLFSKISLNSLHLSKEVLIAFLFILGPVFFPNTANAGIFSFMSNVAGDKVSAKVPETQSAPNSQTMGVLTAVVNSNPTAKAAPANAILASENALVAEIGPAGTASDLDDVVNGEISLYVVRKGDSLAQIAKMFDISVNTIVWANNLDKGAALKEGQTLIILPITGVKYTVKKNDTIKGIVAKYKADLNEVLQFNDLSVNSVLKEGDTILIPDAEQTTSTAAPAVKGSTRDTALAYFTRPITTGHKSQGIHGHNGVDLAAPVGTPIYAAASGKVIASMVNGAWNGGYGNYVIISHSNGMQTMYAHNLTNYVKVGDTVKKGDLIAKIGMTGKTTGPHVHFEVRGGVNPF